MARILILEPKPELLELFVRVARRVGLEPMTDDDGTRPDLVLVEPASDRSLALAHEVRRNFHDVPIVCASTLYPTTQTRGLAPAAHLTKPFRLSRLESTLRDALSSASWAGSGQASGR
jgi:hypothetical protein